ncbi:hypothetical protein LEP1GSC041_3680 [Leptospira noguchii str. 2006001870]|nr:hypothetical protein LEP1GSC041_3680 [Leptospira noguchii str. 2006001870]
MKYEFLFPKNPISFEEVIDTLKTAVLNTTQDQVEFCSVSLRIKS